MIKKRGRPPKVNAKRKGIRIRLNDEEADMLSELSAKTGRTRSDIFVDLMSKEYKRTVHCRRE